MAIVITSLKDIVNRINYDLGGFCNVFAYTRKELAGLEKAPNRNIFLKTDILEQNGQKYFKISIKDNGGGFPNPEKIYKEVVVSSKTNADGSKRMGEGTSYINFFVNLYGGKIEASNYFVEEGLLGAKTEIYFPIID